MPKTTRTFIALAIPPVLGEKLTRLQNQLSPKIPGARWVSTEQPFHVTLAFLGDVLDTDLNAVCRAVEAAASQFRPLELRLEGMGAFPDASRPRVLWAGLHPKEPDLLNNLQKAIARAASDAGYRPDSRFTPHATLGRIKSDRRDPAPADLGPVLERFRSWAGGVFIAREVTTFASTLTPEGPAYAPLARAPLSGKKTGQTP